MVLTVATLLWDANGNSLPFSRCYDESWVEKLYRGFARNLTVPFRFVCFTDRPRQFKEPIFQEAMDLPTDGRPLNYDACIQPFRLGEPMILVGLDTVVLRNIDHLAGWCTASDTLMALPRDPFHWSRACNGVALVPAGYRDVYTTHRGENDMEWIRNFEHVFIDDVFPGSVKSYKGHVRGMTEHFKGVPQGFDGVDICYFHGVPKPHQLHTDDNEIIRRNWI